MRILLLTQIVPYPPDSGPKIKTYNVVRHLARRHEVHLVSFVRTASEVAHAQALRRFCSTVTSVPLHRSRARDIASLVASVLNGRPFLVERDDSRDMREVIRRLVSQHQFDAVHADQLSMAQFAIDLPVRFRVLDEHNAVWTIVQRTAANGGWGPVRVLAGLEWRKLHTYEGEVCRRFDQVTVVSGEDLAALQEAAHATFPAQIIPIAVDTEKLAFHPRIAEARHVVSVATMYYPPNVEAIHWFATEVFPRVRRALPQTTFQIVGSRPPPKITRLATAASGIVVTGYVHDLSDILRQSGVMVVPVQSGSGMRVKILEAFARGIPVVSTTIGVEGIDARAGEHLLVADDTQGFCDAVVRVLRESTLAKRLAQAGRELVQARYDWQTALAGLDTVYGGDRDRQVVNF